jgi:hypothetical protein
MNPRPLSAYRRGLALNRLEVMAGNRGKFSIVGVRCAAGSKNLLVVRHC